MNIQEECNIRFNRENEFLGDSKPVNLINPLVSITVATYQHVNYIKDCLDGILMQITNFPIEVIVGEDESNDGTREICIDYAVKYPDKIRLFLRDRKTSQLYDDQGNFITRFNGIWNRMSSRGKYIAWCEGDDYWTDPYKLQKQVDFLEANPQYTMCFHNAIVKFENINKKDQQFNCLKTNQDIDLKKLINNWIVPTASIVFKKSILPLPEWSSRIYSGDMLIALNAYKHGSIYFMGDKMSIYRKQNNENSASYNAGKMFLYENNQHTLLYELFNKDTNYKYNVILSKRIKFLKKTEKFATLRYKSSILPAIIMPLFTIKKILLLLKKYYYNNVLLVN